MLDSERRNALSPTLSRREREKIEDSRKEREKIEDSRREREFASNSSFPSPSGRGVRGEGKYPLNPELLSFARKLRRETTNAEQLLWHLLRNRRFNGFKFRRQHPVGEYVLDFYCHEARLGVELDGGQHNEAGQRRKDEARSSFLAGEGITVIRFWNNDVLRETEGVMEELLLALSPALSRREREKICGGVSRRGKE